MPDIYLTDEGDIGVSANGDIAMVQDRYHHLSQQAYIRMMTEIGDFRMYPRLGANLDRLIGMPNTPETGAYGRELILGALDREGVFSGVNTDVKAVPISRDAIRFDIFVVAGSRTEMILSIEQSLAPLTLDNGLFLETDAGQMLEAG